MDASEPHFFNVSLVDGLRVFLFHFRQRWLVMMPIGLVGALLGDLRYTYLLEAAWHFMALDTQFLVLFRRPVVVVCFEAAVQ